MVNLTNDQDKWIIILVVISVILSIVAIVLAILIFVYYRKKRRSKGAPVCCECCGETEDVENEIIWPEGKAPVEFKSKANDEQPTHALFQQKQAWSNVQDKSSDYQFDDDDLTDATTITDNRTEPEFQSYSAPGLKLIQNAEVNNPFFTTPSKTDPRSSISDG